MNNVFYRGDDDNGKEAYRKWFQWPLCRKAMVFFSVCTNFGIECYMHEESVKKGINIKVLIVDALHCFILNQQELDDLSKKTWSPLCCDICAKLNPDHLALSGIEKLLSTDCDVDDENANLVSDSSDDAVSYDNFVYESFDNLPWILSK